MSSTSKIANWIEAFPGQSAADVNAFRTRARIYER
jgi:hypothetical protein